MSSGIPPGAFEPLREGPPPDAFAPLGTPARVASPPEPDSEVERLLGMLNPEDAARHKNAAILSAVTGLKPPEAAAFESQMRGKEKPQNVLEYWGEGISNGIAKAEVDELGFKQFMGDTSKETQTKLDAARARLKPEGAQWSKKAMLDPVRIVRSTLEMGPAMIQGMTEGAAKGAALGGAAAIASLPMEAAPGPGTAGQGMTIAAAAGIGFTEGALENIFRKETGSAYVELADVRDANGDALSPTLRRVTSAVIGSMNTALEGMQFGKLFPGLKQRVTKFAAGLVKRGLFSALEDIGANTLQETMQEGVNILATEMAANLQGWLGDAPPAVRWALSGENLKKGLGRVVETAVKSLGTFTVLTAGRGIARASMNAAHPGITQEGMHPIEEIPGEAPVAASAQQQAVAEPAPPIVEALGPEKAAGMTERDLAGLAAFTEQKISVADRVEQTKALAEARALKVDQLLDSMEFSEGSGAREIRQAIAYGKAEGEAIVEQRVALSAEQKKARAEVAHELSTIRNDLKEALSDTERMSPQNAEPIREMLSGLDLVTKRQKKTLASLEKTAQYLADNPEADLPKELTDRLAILSKRPLGDMTMDELREVHDAVMHHAALERKKQEIRTRLGVMSKEKAINQAISEMKPESELSIAKPFKDETAGEKMAKPFKKLGKQLNLRSTHYDLIIENITGQNSVLDKVLGRAIEDGRATWWSTKQKRYDRFRADLENSGFAQGDIAKWMKEKVVKSGTFEDLNRAERISMYLHTLDDDNLNSMLGGGISRQSTADKAYKPTPITVPEIQEIISGMDADELRYARAVANMFAEQGKSIGDVFYRVHGFKLPLRKNYMRKDVNPLARGVDPVEQDAIDRYGDKFVRVGVDHGRLIKRKGSKAAIYLKPIDQVVQEAVNWEANYVAFEEPLTEASKLLDDNRIKEALDTRYGPGVRKEILQGLKDVVKDRTTTSDWERLFGRMRKGMAGATFNLNPWPAAKVILSFPLFGAYVDPRYLARGLMEFDGNRKATIDAHMEWSSKYRGRVEEGNMRDVADRIKKQSAAKKMNQAKGVIKGMWAFRTLDKNTVAAGMQGAVLQALDEFRDGHLTKYVAQALDAKDADIAKWTPAEKMEQAYKFADFVVSRTQDTSAPEHMSPLARGTEFEKMGTRYTTSTNQMFNMLKRAFVQAKRTGDNSRLARNVMYVSLAIVGDALIDSLRAEIYRRKNQPSFFGRMAQSAAGLMYGVGDIVKYAASVVRKGPPGDIDLGPGQLMELAGSMGGNLWAWAAKGNAKNRNAFIDNALEAIAIYYGLPYYGPRAIYRAATGR